MDSDTLLQQILTDELDSRERAGVNPAPTAVDDDEDKAAKSDKESHVQWALAGNGRFMPVGATAARLPAGVYEPFASPGMWGIEKLMVSSDSIYHLPEMATVEVLAEVSKFWSSEARYRTHNLLYKRGLILWGPPGGGKTVAVKLVMNELVKQDGIVIVAQNINLTMMILKAIRRIEAHRNLIVVLEDIDEILNTNGESSVLSMLDGEHNIDNVLHLATTNYPERLGSRIINRPSRFDRRVYVGMPGRAARMHYLLQATNNGLTADQAEQWSIDTKDLSIAHLRELVAAVYCLDQPYEEVIHRLKKMAEAVQGVEEFNRKGVGFNTPSKVAHTAND